MSRLPAAAAFTFVLGPAHIPAQTPRLTGAESVRR